MHDILIRNAHIGDGTGAKPFDGDIALKDGRIVALGKSAAGSARETIDADWLPVSSTSIRITTAR
jgi:N-acyl-D-amino-acid deacylase